MGLSISQSNAERQRIEVSSQKKALSAMNSQAKSMSRNEMSEMRDEIKATMATTPLKLYNNSGKKEVENEEQEQAKNSSSNRKSMEPKRMEVEEEPKIKIAAPSQNKMGENYYNQKYDKKISDFETIQYSYPPNNNLLKPDTISKSIKVESVHPESRQASFFSNQKEEALPNPRDWPRQTMKDVSPAYQPKKSYDKNDNVLLNSGSKTLHTKLPTLPQNSCYLKDKDIPNVYNFDSDFQNFDWEIPKVNDPEIESGRKLKPQRSVVLISKLGKQDQENKKYENSQKKVWKNRRQLMNEIVNDRLVTTDRPFSLDFCMPQSNEA